MGKLDNLKQQREKLNRAIRREETAARKQARKDETRRKILDGALIQNYAETNADMKALLDKLRAQDLKRDQDRALFGLEPLKKGKEDDQQTNGAH